jgi:trehalose/maltose transport system substrate-binding protein
MVRTATAALLLLLAAASDAAVTAELTISCGGVGAVESFLCEQQTARWAARTGHTVHVVKAPDTTEARFDAAARRLRAGDPEVDVFQVDVIWPGLLAEHLLDLSQRIPQQEITRHFEAIVRNNTVDGRLVAVPWFADVGLLYYREDLLERHDEPVPRTWGELAATAARIQVAEREAGRTDLWGLVFQGEAYEGLTCNALEWIHAYGGEVVAADGEIVGRSHAAVAALAEAASWVGTIAPPRVTGYREEDARLTFINGDAVFMRNWPYVWNLLEENPMSPVSGKVGVARLPAGSEEGIRASVLGGWQLAISRYSRHKKEAVELVRYLTSPEVQRERALEGSFAPTIRSLYDDPAVLAASPIFAEMRVILDDVVRRPTALLGDRYPLFSAALAVAVHRVLEGEAEPATVLGTVARRVAGAQEDEP